MRSGLVATENAARTLGVTIQSIEVRGLEDLNAALSAFALQLEAGLSFLGLGTQPPTPSLGGMLADGREVLIQAPWVEIFPGLTIVIAVLAFTLLGEGLRRVFDPRGVAE